MLPEGPGYLLFETIPRGEPPLAAHVKTEREWKRSEVEATIRAWFRFMTVSDEQSATKIREEWGNVFAALPADEDPNQLADERKPKWEDLPVRAGRNRTSQASSSEISSALENPPVNPVTGMGRTGTEVQREVTGYQGYVARLASEFPDKYLNPVFQGHYLLVQLPGAGTVCLARVVHDAVIDSACAADISVTIGEYEHTPQRGYRGLFGTFTKLENLSHDPSDRRATGGKFVRHRSITRTEIIVYDVQTWVDKKLVSDNALEERAPNDFLRIKPSSLRELAKLQPELNPMPHDLPRSHVEAGAEEAATQAERESVRDDPPAPIPPGFVEVVWGPEMEMVIHDFMIFTQLDGGEKQWSKAVVTKVFAAGTRGGYTHDAKFADGIRGVRLTIDAYNSGCWIPLAAIVDQSPPRAGAQAHGRTPARSAGGRATRAVPATGGAAQSGAAQSGAARQRAARPRAAQPGAAQPGAARPGAARPGATHSHLLPWHSLPLTPTHSHSLPPTPIVRNLSSLVRFARVRVCVCVRICEVQSVVLDGIASAFTIIRCL